MLNLRKVAVTGGLSSGKTSVCNFFKQLNAYVVSADDIVHQLLQLQTDLGQQIVALLGNDVVKNGILDRELIGKKVFDNFELLEKLEDCLYPVVFEEIKRHYQKAKQLNFPLFVVEAPKLFEAKMEPFFDAVITISTDKAIALARFIDKGKTQEDYDKRMANQMPLEQKIKRSKFIITNNGNLNQLKSAATKLFYVLTQEELLSP